MCNLLQKQEDPTEPEPPPRPSAWGSSTAQAHCTQEQGIPNKLSQAALATPEGNPTGQPELASAAPPPSTAPALLQRGGESCSPQLLSPRSTRFPKMQQTSPSGQQMLG